MQARMCALLRLNVSSIEENICHCVPSILQDFADREKIPFLETSAKSTTNVEKAFVTIATEMMRIRSGH